MDRRVRNPASPDQHRIWGNRLFTMRNELSIGAVGTDALQKHFRKNSRVMNARRDVVAKIDELRRILEDDLAMNYSPNDRDALDVLHVYFQGGCERSGCHHDERQV